jgi:phosphoglycerol transferase MdoB-like AlkP superfamily enzyme
MTYADWYFSPKPAFLFYWLGLIIIIGIHMIVSLLKINPGNSANLNQLLAITFIASLLIYHIILIFFYHRKKTQDKREMNKYIERELNKHHKN